MFLFRDQEVILCFEKICPIINRDLEIIPVRYCIFRTGFDAITAENAAAVVDVINLCVAFVAADPLIIRPRVSFRLDVNTIRRTRRGAKIARDAFFLASFIDVQ